jgi:TolB protein
LASTIYNLLTGQKPVDAVERMLGQAVLTPLNLLIPNIPPQVQSAIEKAMSVRPEERFPSVQEFIQTLTQPLSEITQQPDQNVTRVAVPPPPSSDTSTRVGVPYASPPPLPQKKRQMWWLIPVILIPLLVILIGGGWFVMTRLLTPTPTSTTVADLTLTEIPAVLPTETTLPTFAELPTEIPTEIPTDLPTNTPEPTLEPTPEPTPEPTATPAVVLEPIGRGGIVAFASNEGDGSSFQIWSMRVFLDESQNLIAAEKQQLTNTAGDKFYPAWSPDGGQIVYAADSGDAENKFDLYVMDANGENQTLLVAQPGDDTEPAWSPDGNWIVFTSDSRSDGILQLHIVKPDGSDLHRISFDKQEFSPEWSPRMDKLVYIVTVNNARYLWIRDPQDNFADTETNLMYGRLGYFADPAWSPDAEWLAFTREEGRTRDIYLTKISSFGMEISRLTETTFDSYPAWSSDSQWLLFNSNRDGNQEIYIMNRDGSLQTNLTQTDNVQELQPAWQIK